MYSSFSFVKSYCSILAIWRALWRAARATIFHFGSPHVEIESGMKSCWSCSNVVISLTSMYSIIKGALLNDWPRAHLLLSNKKKRKENLYKAKTEMKFLILLIEKVCDLHFVEYVFEKKFLILYNLLAQSLSSYCYFGFYRIYGGFYHFMVFCHSSLLR